MTRALDLESQRWARDEAPQRLNGHCHSELAIDIIQVAQPARARSPPSIPAPFPACPVPSPQPWSSWAPAQLTYSLQIISRGEVKAEKITLDLGKQIKSMLLAELAAFLRRWVCPEGLQPLPCARLGSRLDWCPSGP